MKIEFNAGESMLQNGYYAYSSQIRSENKIKSKSKLNVVHFQI